MKKRNRFDRQKDMDEWNEVENSKLRRKPINLQEEIEINKNNLFKEYSYEELFKMSEELSKDKYNRYTKWNKLSVSSYDNVEGIFYDIAHSNKNRKIYIKVNLFHAYILFFKILLILLFLFCITGLILSKFISFYLEVDEWKKWAFWTLISNFIFSFLNNIFFDDYFPNNNTGKINREINLHRTSWTIKFGASIIGYKKAKTKSRYQIYKAHNGKEYLIWTWQDGRYYSIRNWYLISKYITLGKMSINDLDEHFEDELFVYLTTNGYKKDQLKLKCIFSPKISLNIINKIWEIIFLINILSVFVFFILNFSIW